jgi:formylmethanofuran--tetrahydromethanopterin N-formyltransferase
MEGEYIGEEEFGAVKGVAAATSSSWARTRWPPLRRPAAVDAISGVCGVITPSRRHRRERVEGREQEVQVHGCKHDEAYCPTLREKVEGSKVPEGVKAVYEIVIDGVDEDSIKTAMAEGIRAATKVPGVKFISAGNFGGSLGPFKFELKDVLADYL